MDVAQLIQTIQFVIDSFRDDSLSKIIMAEIDAAEIATNTLTKEANVRDGLNRILTHLESAYVLYTKKLDKIHIFDLFDYENNMYKKAGMLNKICEGLAYIHYKLGNIEIAQIWLHKMLNYGECHYPQYLYKAILQDEYSNFKVNVLDISDSHRRSIEISKEIAREQDCGFNPNML